MKREAEGQGIIDALDHTSFRLGEEGDTPISHSHFSTGSGGAPRDIKDPGREVPHTQSLPLPHSGYSSSSGSSVGASFVNESQGRRDPIRELPHAQSLPASTPAQLAHHKRMLFIKILKEECMAELLYAWNIMNRRAEPRRGLEQQVAGMVADAASLIPMVGQTIVQVGRYGNRLLNAAANEEDAKRTKRIANIKNQLHLVQLEILFDKVAREACRRYENFIVDYTSDNMKKSVIPFARVGARRMLWALAEQEITARNEDELIASLEETLLTGLIEGRSGSGVDGFSNHELELKRMSQGMLSNIRPKHDTIDAEDVYARSGFRRYEIKSNTFDSKSSDCLFTLRQRGVVDRARASMSGQNFGYVVFREPDKYKNDPKAGYAIMPAQAIERYEFEPQEKTALSSELQAELKNTLPTSIEIDRATVVRWVTSMERSVSLRDYVRSISSNRGLETIIFHGNFGAEGDFPAIDLRGRDLSHTDLSDGILSGDLSGTRFNHSYLIRTRMQGVTSLRGASFHQAGCQYLQAERLDFTNATLTQANFSYAKLANADFTNSRTTGAIWIGADLRGTIGRDVLGEQQEQLNALQVRLTTQEQRFTTFETGMRAELARLQASYNHLMEQSTQSVPADVQSLQQAYSTIERLLREQFNNLALENYCREQIAELRVAIRDDDAAIVALAEELAAVQSDLQQLRESLQENQAARVNELATLLQSFGETQDAAWREEFVSFRQSLQTTLEQQSQESRQHVQQLQTELTQLQASVSLNQAASSSTESQALAAERARIAADRHRLDDALLRLDDGLSRLDDALRRLNEDRRRFEEERTRFEAERQRILQPTRQLEPTLSASTTSMSTSTVSSVSVAQSEAQNQQRFMPGLVSRQPILAVLTEQQNELRLELVAACEKGDIALVREAIRAGAQPFYPNLEEKQPLGAAVWGMNPNVVAELLQRMGGVSQMTWRDCEVHNIQHYAEVFIIAKFDPYTFSEWGDLVEKMTPNSFIRAYHLGKAMKDWHPFQASFKNWDDYVSWVARLTPPGYVRGGNNWKFDTWSETETEFASYRRAVRQKITEAAASVVVTENVSSNSTSLAGLSS